MRAITKNATDPLRKTTMLNPPKDYYAKILSQEYSLLVIFESIMVSDVHKKDNSEHF